MIKYRGISVDVLLLLLPLYITQVLPTNFPLIWSYFEIAFLPSAAIGPTGIVVGHCVRPSVRLSVRPERRSRSNSLRISANIPKFGGMMHSTMEQIAI